MQDNRYESSLTIPKKHDSKKTYNNEFIKYKNIVIALK